jgi:putative NADPH-quinone reductase
LTRIAIIDGHPEPDGGLFVHALVNAYVEGASRFHQVDLIEVGRLDFPLIRSSAEWRDARPCHAIEEAQHAIFRASHLVFVYPLWLGGTPALVKGFLEQVMRPDFAIGQYENGRAKHLLKGRSARVVVTMAMPAPVYSLFYRAHSVRSLERSVLRFGGIGPIRRSLIGNIEDDAKARQVWLTQMRELGMCAE